MACRIEPGMKLEAFTENSFSGWWAMRDSVTEQEIGTGDGGFEEQDARLFAAAPDMFKLLKDVQGMLYAQDLSSSQVGVAVADIINKVEGK